MIYIILYRILNLLLVKSGLSKFSSFHFSLFSGSTPSWISWTPSSQQPKEREESSHHSPASLMQLLEAWCMLLLQSQFTGFTWSTNLKKLWAWLHSEMWYLVSCTSPRTISIATFLFQQKKCWMIDDSAKNIYSFRRWNYPKCNKPDLVSDKRMVKVRFFHRLVWA